MDYELFKKDYRRAMLDIENAQYTLERLFYQMDLNNPTPINKMAYRGAEHGLKLLEKARDELGKGECFNPLDKMPRTNNCHLCAYFGNCTECRGFVWA